MSGTYSLSTSFVPMRWMGVYSATLPYNPGNVVSYGGASWVCLATATGVTPVAGASWAAAAVASVLADGSLAFTGPVVFSLNVAPADGALVASQCAMWFDNTNGAGKVMFKGKTANGAVATGSVTLT